MDGFIKALAAGLVSDERKETLSLFGQFVGEWDFEWIYNKGAADEQRLPGEWIFSWILDGTAIQDVFICPARGEQIPHPNAEYGTTIRFYNPSKDAWEVCYGCGDGMCVLETKQVGDQIILTN